MAEQKQQVPPLRSSGFPVESGDGKREKDGPLMGLRPVLVNPRTLMRTWGTQTELVCGKSG
jgi:hypothetical protein